MTYKGSRTFQGLPAFSAKHGIEPEDSIFPVLHDVALKLKELLFWAVSRDPSFAMVIGVEVGCAARVASRCTLGPAWQGLDVEVQGSG